MLEMMNSIMFAIVSMRRITGVEISKKSKWAKQKKISEKFENTGNLIYTACAMLQMMIYTMFAIVRKMPIAGVEISTKSKCAEQTAISKSLKTM